jgi:ribonucleoside-triphosphate reductase
MIVTDIEASIGNKIPDVEKVQDTVEKILIKEGHDALAKAYILYREKRAQNRDAKKVVVEVGQTMDEYLDQTDWRVSANSNQ